MQPLWHHPGKRLAFLGTKSRRSLEGSERRARGEQENQLRQKHQEQEGKPFSFRSLLMPLTPGTCRYHTRAEPWEELGTKEQGCPRPQPLPPRQQTLWHLFEGFGDRREASAKWIQTGLGVGRPQFYSPSCGHYLLISGQTVGLPGPQWPHL